MNERDEVMKNVAPSSWTEWYDKKIAEVREELDQAKTDLAKFQAGLAPLIDEMEKVGIKNPGTDDLARTIRAMILDACFQIKHAKHDNELLQMKYDRCVKAKEDSEE